MNKSIVLTQNSRIEVTVTDLRRKPGALVYLWAIAEYSRPTTERRTPLMIASLVQAKPTWRAGKVAPGNYVLESATLPETCFDVTITPE
jgi:hypothetical protein